MNKCGTCGTAESAGVPQIGEQFAAADVVEQHVQERLIVVGPHPAFHSIPLIQLT